MTLIYDEHAVSRMQLRKISVETVNLIVTKPDGKIPQSKDKWIYNKTISGRSDNLIAIVILHSEGVPKLILTVMNNFEVKR